METVPLLSKEGSSFQANAGGLWRKAHQICPSCYNKVRNEMSGHWQFCKLLDICWYNPQEIKLHPDGAAQTYIFVNAKYSKMWPCTNFYLKSECVFVLFFSGGYRTLKHVWDLSDDMKSCWTHLTHSLRHPETKKFRALGVQQQEETL